MDRVKKTNAPLARLLFNELRRGLGGAGVWLAAGCFFALQMLGAWEELPVTGDSIYRAMNSFSISEFQRLLPCVCAFPYALSVIQDRENNYLHFLLLRSGARRYIIGKVMAAVLCSLCAAILGLLVTFAFLAAQCTWEPVEIHVHAGGQLIQEGRVAEFWILQWLIRSFAIACLSLPTVIAAGWTMNKYIAILSPLLFQYAIEIVIVFARPIPFIGSGLYHWYSSYAHIGIATGFSPEQFHYHDYLLDFLKGYGPYFFVFVLIMVLAMRRQVKRRV